MARVIVSSSRKWMSFGNTCSRTPFNKLSFSPIPASLQQNNCQQQISKRFLTNQDALGILSLNRTQLTPATLRTAYLQAAKECHPDTSQNADHSKEEAAIQFRLVTEAYEFLLRGKLDSDDTGDYGITIEEEASFRRACQERLGLPAEIVEESKQCPAFRQWLDGKTDAAHYWRVFFIQHGGLAPKLRPPSAGLLESNVVPTKSSTRRRRPSQSTNL